MPVRVKRWLVGIGIAIAVASVLILIINFVLLYTRLGFIFNIGGLQLIKLGTATESVYPPQIESAFEKTTNKQGLVMRIAKYIDDVQVNSEENGVVIATHLGTQSQRRYSFHDYTSYMCGDPTMVSANIPKVSIDPKKDLAKYLFIFQGDGFRGNEMPASLNNFRQDLNNGDPAKMYLLRPTPDADGTYPLVHVILFTSNDSCVNTSFNGAAIPDANVQPNAK